MYMQQLTRMVECGFDHPAVSTKQGILKGIQVEGCFLFRGVDYAKSSRFLPPEPVDNWAGIRRAECFGTGCRTLYLPQETDSFQNPRYSYPESEHCQNLNIWTPVLGENKKLPVLVWLEGDGWLSGGSMASFATDGGHLATQEHLVVVGINHRQNVLGCLDLSAYGQRYQYTTELGILDISQALKWIQENIRFFGGDPQCVTLAGFGGGAERILALMHHPAADSLYHRVILETPTHPIPQSSEEDKRFTAFVLQQLHLTPETIGTIETADWYDLATATISALWQYEKQTGKHYRFQPNSQRDDYRNACSPVPVMLAFHRHEEMAYPFRNAAYMEGLYQPGISEQLENTFSSRWADFARNGRLQEEVFQESFAFSGDSGGILPGFPLRKQEVL